MLKKLFGRFQKPKITPGATEERKRKPLKNSLRATYGVRSPAASNATTYHSALSSPAPSVFSPNTPNAISPKKVKKTATPSKKRKPRGSTNPSKNNSIAALRRAYQNERITVKAMNNPQRSKVRRVFEDAASSIEGNLVFLRQMLAGPVNNAATLRRYVKDLEQYRKYVAAQYFEWTQSRAWNGTGSSSLPIWPLDPRTVSVRANLNTPSAYASQRTAVHPSVQKALNRQITAVRRARNARAKRNANYLQLVNNVFSSIPNGNDSLSYRGKGRHATPIGLLK
jgi:hypothetical protein